MHAVDAGNLPDDLTGFGVPTGTGSESGLQLLSVGTGCLLVGLSRAEKIARAVCRVSFFKAQDLSQPPRSLKDKAAAGTKICSDEA